VLLVWLNFPAGSLCPRYFISVTWALRTNNNSWVSTPVLFQSSKWRNHQKVLLDCRDLPYPQTWFNITPFPIQMNHMTWFFEWMVPKEVILPWTLPWMLFHVLKLNFNYNWKIDMNQNLIESIAFRIKKQCILKWINIELKNECYN